MVAVMMRLAEGLEECPAIAEALRELDDACASMGMKLGRGPTSRGSPSLAITVSPSELGDPEGFRIRTKGDRGWQIVGASAQGAARGLAYLADRIRTLGRVPKLDVAMNPAFPMRFMHIGVGSLDLPTAPYVNKPRYDAVLDQAKKDIARSFRLGANHIVLHSTYRVASWPEPPHSDRTQTYRQLYSDIVQESHRYGMKSLLMGDELLYQDSMLVKERARLSPEDSGMWNLLQNRYREILGALPEMDGIAVRIGEMLPIGNIRSFDVIHNDSKLSIEEKYRRFVKAMYQVVVDEFDKIYYHRTWVVNDWEQHSVPSIYKSIFQEIPTRNLIVSIKLTKCDQWWYQAFNPTLGQTRHATAVELEMVHGPHGCQIYPDYMGEWFQAGLNYALNRRAKAVMTGFPSTLWMDAHHYAARRLFWEPHLPPKVLAEDWASQTFGRRAARPIAKMLLMSNDAMEKSLYIGPYASTHAWNPIPHLFTGLFPAEGNPFLDRGRGHAAFLRDFYLLSKPHFDEALEEMEEGLRIYGQMLGLFSQASRHIRDRDRSRQARKGLLEGRDFLTLNVAYVSAFMHFFRYEEEGTERSKRQTQRAIARLKKALDRYGRRVGWFSTIGVETFVDLAERGLADLGTYRRALKDAPDASDVEKILREARARDEALANAPDARKFLYFEADIDGMEVLTVGDGTLAIQHISDEQSRDVRYEFYQTPPPGGRLAIKPLEVRGWAYIIEQPTIGNDWKARILVHDPQNGRSIYRFEVFWIPEKARS